MAVAGTVAVALLLALVGAPRALAAGTRTTTTELACPPVTVGVPTTCTATVTDVEATGTKSAPTGNVTFAAERAGTFTPLSSSCELKEPGAEKASCAVKFTPATAGSQKITATYPGDSEHAASSGSATPAITKRATATTVACAPAVMVGQVAECTATVADKAAGTQSAPEGEVRFSAGTEGSFPNGRSCELKAPVGAKSTCSVSYLPASAGSVTVEAAYDGDSIHNESEGSGSVAVSLRTTAILLSCGEAVAAGHSTQCVATVTDTAEGIHSAPKGSVMFSSPTGDGVFSASSCALEPSGASESCAVEYTPAKPGKQSLTASYMDSEKVHQTSTVTSTFEFTPRASKISISCSASVLVGAPDVCALTVADETAEGASTPTGTMTLTSNTSGGAFALSQTCTLGPVTGTARAGCIVVYTPGQLGSGAHTLKAEYSGDPLHAAGSAEVVISVTAPAAATTTTTTTPSPTPAPLAPQPTHATAPKCQLVARETWKKLKRPRKHEVPELSLSYSCDQNASVRIQASIAVAARGKGHARTKARAYTLPSGSYAVVAGQSAPAVVLALPSGVLNALSAKQHTAATVKFTVQNTNGTGIASLKLALTGLH